MVKYFTAFVMGMIAVVPLHGKADIMNDRLTHHDSQGVLKDIFERFSSHRGKLWHEAIRRFLVGASTEFYMLEIGDSGNLNNLLEKFSHAGLSISPLGGEAEKDLRKSKPRQCYGERECFRMVPVRAMDFDRTKCVDHKTPESKIRHIGLLEGCVATSWEAACKLLLETKETGECGRPKRRSLLEMSPTPIVWTFVAGNHENRTNFATNAEGERPKLIGLVSEDAGLGFKGIAEATYLHQRLGRDRGAIFPSDIFVFSINTD